MLACSMYGHGRSLERTHVIHSINDNGVIEEGVMGTITKASGVGLLLWGLTIGGGALSSATEPAGDLPLQDRTHLVEFLSDYGVASEVQDALLAELTSGGVWQSAVHGAEPVSERLSVADGADVRVLTYADGSIKVSRIEREHHSAQESSTGIRNVSGCRTTFSNHYYASYTDCKVEDSNGLLTLGFPVAYTRYVGGPGRIDAIGSPHWLAVGGTYSSRSTRIGLKQGTPAWAETSGVFTAYGNVAQHTAYVRVRVQGSRVWTESDLSLW